VITTNDAITEATVGTCLQTWRQTLRLVLLILAIAIAALAARSRVTG
jgi:hypothetical protein